MNHIFINVHSPSGGIILDLSGGSGACAFACKNTLRHCIYNDRDTSQFKAAIQYFESRMVLLKKI